ncbi:unnamed protein product [Closterium sp. NIES-54]
MSTDPGIEATALGATDSALPGIAPAEALHTFTLDSGASRCFFRDSTTLTPLSAPVPVRLADPSGGRVLARYSTVLSCPAVPSSSLSGLHLPSFSTNLVSITALQDAMVTTTTPGGQRVSICTCTRTGRHLATLNCRPGSILYTLATEPPQVAASAQVSTSGPVAPPCSCRLLSHHTLLWHNCLGHPSLPRLRGMHSRLLVSGLPRSLPPLPPSRAPPCLPCVEGRQRAAPHSSSFPPTTTPLQALHMNVWGPAHVSGQSRERYFLLVVDDYTRYTTIFPLRSKGEVPDILIPWIRAVRLQLRGRFCQDLPVLRLHSDRGGEFSSDLLRDFCRGEGILQSFTLPYSPQQNGIAERRIGLVMEVARTSMIHAAAPLFLWPFAFYHPTSRRVIPSQDVTFDELVPFYRLFTFRSAPPPPPPLFLVPGPPPVDPLPPEGPAPSGVSQVNPLPCTVPVEVAVDSGAARGAACGGAVSGGAEPGGAESKGAGAAGAKPGGAEPGGAEPAGVEPGGVEPEGVDRGGAESEGAESGGAEPRGIASSGGPAGASPPLSPRLEPFSLQQLREWFTHCTRLRSGHAGAGASAAGDIGAGGARGGGTDARGAGAGGAGAGGAGAGGSWSPPASPLPAPSPYIEQTGRLSECRELKSRPASPVRTVHTDRRVPRPRPPPVPGTHAMALRPSFVPLRVPLPPPPESSLPAIPDPESDLARAASPTVSHLLATVVTDLSFEFAAASALVAELVDYATALVTESESASPPFVEGECGLGTDVLEDRQEDLECLAAAVPRFASMLLAPEGDPDAPDIPTPHSYAEAITGPYSSQWQAAMDAKMASWKSTGTYVDAVPPSRANLVDGMWIFKVKRPPGSPPSFKARYVARGFSQRQGVDYFQTFSPTPKMTTLRVLLHVADQREYELHSLHFSTAFLQGSLHEEIWLRRPSGFTGSFPAGTQWSLRQPVYGLRQASRKWHDTPRTTLVALGFIPSTADPSLFLRTDTSPPPFYVLVYVDDLVFATADTEALTLVKLELQKRHTCTDLGELRSNLGLQITRDRARRTITLTQSHMVQQVLQRFDFTWSSPQPTPLSTGHSLSATPSDESIEPSGPYPELVGCLISSCKAEIYAGAMAALELRWLTYLLTDYGERPRSPPVLYVDNKHDCLVSGPETGAQNEAHCSPLLPHTRAAAAWSASSCLRGHTGQHC